MSKSEAPDKKSLTLLDKISNFLGFSAFKNKTEEPEEASFSSPNIEPEEKNPEPQTFAYKKYNTKTILEIVSDPMDDPQLKPEQDKGPSPGKK